MKTATKAALLSGLVFPGVGQMYLKRVRRGLFFMIPVLLGIAIIVAMATVEAMESLKTIQAQGGTVNSNAITAAAQTHAKETAGYFRAILLFMVIFWIAAIIDAYRIGPKQTPEGP